MSERKFVTPSNPNYGNGVFRRRILLRSLGQNVIAELEDDNHAFHINMGHDGHVINSIAVDFVRVPRDVCDGAGKPLGQLVGAALSDSPLALTMYADSRANCTHLFDLLSFAVTHAKRGEKRRQYHALIWDQRNGKMSFELQCNSDVVLAGVLHQGIFLSPAKFHGRSIYNGFTTWGREALDSIQLEAALVLQRAHFVSITRRLQMDKLAGIRVIDVFGQSAQEAVCYAHIPGVLEHSVWLPNAVRNYSETPDDILAFSWPKESLAQN